MRLGIAVASAALAVAIGACAGVGDFFREPEVRLSHVVVRSISLGGGTLDFAVDVHNPNSFDLRGTEVRVGFDVENSHLGDVDLKQDFAVQRGDTTRLTLPVSFQWAGVGTAVRAALGYGEIPYKMSGEISLQTPFGRRAVPFTREGRAPLTRTGSGIRIPGSD